MKTLNKILKNKKGGILLMLTIFSLFSIMFIALISADIVINNILVARNQVFSTRAYFAAEAGVERILWEVRKNNFNIEGDDGCSDDDCIDWNGAGLTSCVECDDSPPELNINNAIVVVNYNDCDEDETGCDHIFISTGEYREVRRAVEIRF